MANSTKQPAPAKPTAAEAKALKAAQAKRERDQLALANKIARLRADKVAWDGDGGICEQVGIRSATSGRQLLRRFNLTDKAPIAPSYDRAEAKAKREAAASK